MQALELDNFSYAWPGAERWTLREIGLQILPGECHCLMGATGSGKTTLALALKGLLPPGRQTGELRLPTPPGGRRAGVGMVLQNPETQILTETIGAEVAFGLENLGVAPEEMPGRVAAALAAGLPLPLDHPTGRLSMGQKYRLLIAAQLVMEPVLLILDEPAGQLDRPGLRDLAEAIGRLKQKGLSVLLCEHAPEPLVAVIDRCWHLTGTGTLAPGQLPAPVRNSSPGRSGEPAPRGAAPVVQVSDLSIDAQDATPAWKRVSLTIGAGERVMLCAPNGAGKTTLLRCLAGFIRPKEGEVRIFGEPPAPERLRGRIGYLLQNPGRQLFETTVFAEVAFSLRRCGTPRAAVRERVERSLTRCGIAELADHSPHRLSYGQKHLVALAAILAPAPQLLLLDDPFAGLDAECGSRAVDLLMEVTKEGTALLWTGHDDQSRPDWAHTILGIDGGALVPL